VKQRKWNKPRQALSHMVFCGVETCPPPPRALIAHEQGHYRFSILAALKRDGPGWCTSREFASSLICDPIHSYRIVFVYILTFISNPVILSLGTLLKCFIRVVLIVIIF
jgi:hypothetical protein